MEPVHIDPNQGPHAAADLSNEALQALCELVLWELAIRTDQAQFVEYLHTAIARSAEAETALGKARHERDLMHFAASVMLDIQRLPASDDSAESPRTGMYL